MGLSTLKDDLSIKNSGLLVSVQNWGHPISEENLEVSIAYLFPPDKKCFQHRCFTLLERVHKQNMERAPLSNVTSFTIFPNLDIKCEKGQILS